MNATNWSKSVVLLPFLVVYIDELIIKNRRKSMKYNFKWLGFIKMTWNKWNDFWNYLFNLKHRYARSKKELFNLTD